MSLTNFVPLSRTKSAPQALNIEGVQDVDMLPIRHPSLTTAHIKITEDTFRNFIFVLIITPPPLKNGAGGILYSGLSVCEWWREGVSLCVPKTLWIPCLKNLWRKFHPILVTDVNGLIDMMISFWRQRVKRSRSQQAEAWPLTEARRVQSSLIFSSVDFGKIKVIVQSQQDQTKYGQNKLTAL